AHVSRGGPRSPPANARNRLAGPYHPPPNAKSYPAEKIKPGSEPDEALCALADYEAGRGNIPEAIEIYKKLLGQVLAWEPKPDTSLADAVDLSRLYAALATLYRRAPPDEGASALDARRLELWRRWDSRLPQNSFVRRQLDAATGARQISLRITQIEIVGFESRSEGRRGIQGRGFQDTTMKPTTKGVNPPDVF